jgi:catechol-2,3-dioxygenase
LGLIAISILVPSASDVDALLRRLQEVGAAVKSDGEAALRTADPDGNFIELGVK